MRMMGQRVEHIQVLATLAIAPAIITAWYVCSPSFSHANQADDRSILVIGQIPLVWPRTAFEWALLASTVVSHTTLHRHELS